MVAWLAEHDVTSLRDLIGIGDLSSWPGIGRLQPEEHEFIQDLAIGLSIEFKTNKQAGLAPPLVQGPGTMPVLCCCCFRSNYIFC